MKWMILKRIVIYSLLTIVIFSSVFYAKALFDQGVWRFNYPDLVRFPIQGIDVSHHQGDIDWPSVAKNNVRFAYIKATEGGDFRDTRFQENWREAQSAGIVTGVYHFFTFCREGRLQAQNFIENVPPNALQLPPAVDLEFGGNCSKVPDKQELISELEAFLHALERQYDKPVVFYTTRGFYHRYFKDKPFPNALWYRNIYFEPKQPAWRFWQYHSRGRLSGINTPVDLNVFRGDEEGFRQYLASPTD